MCKMKTEEQYIKAGITIFKIVLLAFIIIFACLYFVNLDNKIAVFKIVYWVDFAINIILGIIAFNLLMKKSTDNRFDFFEKVKINSVYFKAKIWVVVYFLIMFLNIAMLCALTTI